MPAYELQFGYTLAACGACSFVYYVAQSIRSARTGKVQLPAGDGSLDESENDPFKMLKPGDLVDGEPLDEEKFWKWTKMRKLLLFAILISILGINGIFLHWTRQARAPTQILVQTLHASLSLYLCILSLRWLWQNTVSTHSKTTVHLSILTSATATLLGLSALIPSAPFEDTYPHGKPTARLWYSRLVLYVVATAIAITTPRGPRLHLPLELIYAPKTISARTNPRKENVVGVLRCSIFDLITFSYATPVVRLGAQLETLNIADFPVVPSASRASVLFTTMRHAMKTVNLRVARPGSGFGMAWRLLRVNWQPLAGEVVVTVIVSALYYAPKYFLKLLVQHLEMAPEARNIQWAWVFVVGMIMSTVAASLLFDQVIYFAQMTLQVRIRIELNSILFAKTLARKDIASSSEASQEQEEGEGEAKAAKKDEKEAFSSKAQVMTLITTDVDRVANFPIYMFSVINCPVEISVATALLYNILGSSCFVGLAVAIFTVPMNHFAGNLISRAQENLMKTRDERVSLMNEVLGAIRMLKFMAWERNFEQRVMKIRDRELYWQKMTFAIEVCLNAIWDSAPIMITLISFYHFAVVRGEPLAPSVAFTAIAVFAELRYALNNVPETVIKVLQAFVSLRRMERYLDGAEITHSKGGEYPVAFRNATVTWPQDKRTGSSQASSAASTPRRNFVLSDVTLDFPKGELTLICGKLGSGKTLMLLALLGEAELLAGQVTCPRSRPDAIADFAKSSASEDDWIVEGISAYVPQIAWLRNASIRDNILFDLPYVEERYNKTIEACALLNDFAILEDGDQSEIGEQGIGLSGGQKARVSLARAVYSRASTVLLDDVLSAVDAHTAGYIYDNCLKGELMRGRTVILVSHHVQLCSVGAKYIVALDNGSVQFSGSREGFQSSGLIDTLMQSGAANIEDDEVLMVPEDAGHDDRKTATDASSETAVSTTESNANPEKTKSPRKLVEDEARATGRVSAAIWTLFIKSCGGSVHWAFTIIALLVAAAGPLLENGWLKIWSGASLSSGNTKSPMFYISVYAVIRFLGLVTPLFRSYMFFSGSIRASKRLYKNLLETVLFAPIRFHDTVSKGRLLNRFGKDFEVIDSQMAEQFGRSVFMGLDMTVVFIIVCYVGGIMFIIPFLALGLVYVKVSNVYAQTARDMRRLDSVSRSPVLSIYGETISGVPVIRAFGASTKFMADMLRSVDTNSNPYYWQQCTIRWLDVRLGQISNFVVGLIAVSMILRSGVDASLAGFTLSMSSSMVWILTFLVFSFVGLEQSMVSLERVKEYSELPREAPEFLEPRPPASWPSEGEIVCEDLVIRYAPELPPVIHGVSFTIKPSEKVGILGRTGSGKSTLAMSLFRFVEASEGRILIDGVDTSKIGLTDLRSRLTIIPQDPTILSGTVRSTLDVFGEYQDAEIFEALRRVHLIPSEEDDAAQVEMPETINVNVFRNLDSPVSEGGENFSTGEKQLLCMARAILKRSKVLVMDEATASVDYATDELIGKTIRHEFRQSTILTIAHRLRTVIDYDRVMVLDAGKIVEFANPGELLADRNSKFYALCKATGKEEFSVLRKLAHESASKRA
ncbi:multidrug resistance-associated ABC transporter [Punctularia strigosozonata HHB-11173 SS5]|uniref:multidrug resistance-associated ABC transporter n=1 Tax=Punctularia strigosozonata (strain HHB-11173) TaxID=741275 RepID=UPI00044165AD|nr:multidrug resistance-associated ABC transporter [Punctularia strigosozonata HHB-11173 SS5]EIN12781.1 multidrug resistance-associated ABC transporter [Punctularia strigosozonata HHB-11173 SS5]